MLRSTFVRASRFLVRPLPAFTPAARLSSTVPPPHGQGPDPSDLGDAPPVHVRLPWEDPELLGRSAVAAAKAAAAAEGGEEEVAAPSGPFVNPTTGEVNGPRGPEPTRYASLSLHSQDL